MSKTTRASRRNQRWGTAGQTVRQYLSILKPYRASGVTILVLLVIAIVAADIAVPYLVAEVLDALAMVANGSANLDAATQPFWAAVGVSLIGLVAWRIVGFWNVLRQPKELRDLERHVFDRLTLHSYAFFADRFGGSLVTQANRYIRSYEMLEDTVFYQSLPLLIRLVASLTVLLIVIPSIGLALTVWSVLFIVTTTWMAISQQPYARKASDTDSWTTGRLADVIANILNLKSFGRRREERQSYRELNQRKYRIRREAWVRHEAIWTYTHIMGVIVTIVVLWLSIQAVAGGAAVAMVLLAQFYAIRLTGDLSDLQNILKGLSNLFGDAAEMTQILEYPLEVTDPERPEKIRIVDGRVRFDGIRFAYGRRKPVFDQLTLEIESGQRIGLVGHSGSGKSTLVKLLLRFVDVQQGTITIDGQDIRKIRQDDLRSRIAYVAQEPILFHRSLADNIRYAKPSASMEEVRRVAKLAHADEFIDALPDGYDTLVGERGIKLSGGEKQRVAIARAMLSDAPVLVLDEATSSLDSESEALITDALKRLMHQRTTIVIAHRLSTIRDLDLILVMDHGKIVERGTHKQLLKRRGPYRELWEHQTGGFIGE